MWGGAGYPGRWPLAEALNGPLAPEDLGRNYELALAVSGWSVRTSDYGYALGRNEIKR